MIPLQSLAEEVNLHKSNKQYGIVRMLFCTQVILKARPQVNEYTVA